MKELTSNVYSFENLIRGNFLYVDKTEYVWKLIRPTDAMPFSRKKKELLKGLAVCGSPK